MSKQVIGACLQCEKAFSDACRDAFQPAVRAFVLTRKPEGLRARRFGVRGSGRQAVCGAFGEEALAQIREDLKGSAGGSQDQIQIRTCQRSLPYSAFACLRMGISGSASFHRVRKFS